MTVRISELNELSVDLSQADVLPIVDISAAETKQIKVSSLLEVGISGAPSSFIDLIKLNQSSATKLASTAFADTGVASGVYGGAATVAQFIVNAKGLITSASGVPIAIDVSGVTGLAPVATSGTYASLSGLPTLGTLSSQDSNSVAISGGTVSGVVLVTGNATISGGTISGITDIAIADGGTGASTASGARTNLGLVIGSDIQAYSAVLSGVAGQFDEANEVIYASASGVVASTPFTAFARSIASGTTAAEVRATLGLGTLAVQDASSLVISGGTISGITLITGNVVISGGTISGITDISIADGGTGASSAADARTNLGLAIGTDVQAYSAVLSGVAAQFTTADELIYASASGIVSSTPFTSFARSIASGSTASEVRDTLALASMALQDAGSVAISGGTISGITDLAVADGGTGASSATDARTNLGLAIGTDVQAYDAGLLSIAGLTTAADQLLYLTGVDIYATSPLPSYSRDFLASGNSASDARTVLELGTLSTQSIISSGDIGTAVVSGANILPGSLTFDNYGAGSVVEAVIADGAVSEDKIAISGVTASKLADNSSTIVALGAPITAGTFIGQQYQDTATDFVYVWDGNSWERIAALSTIDFVDSTPIAFAVSYPDNYSATVTTTLENQAANSFFSGPSSGVAAAPTFRAIVSSDLPIATDGTVGAMEPGTGLAVDGAGTLNHSNSTVPGSYAGAVTIDEQGHVVSAFATLQASDIPDLDASKIISGSFGSTFLAENSVTASQLADYGIAQVSESAPTPEFAGQWWINPNDRAAYIWVGEVTPVPNGYWLNLGYGSPTQINLRFGGTYNASGNTVASINSYGIEAGLTIGQGLSSPNTSNNGVYLIVTASGTGTAPAPAESLDVGNWVLSEGIGASWTKIGLYSAVAGVSDQDVLVAGASLVPAASGIASQEDFNESVWPKVQIANDSTAGIVRASTEVVVASGTGIMTLGIIDDGTYA
jgi:hypothetical protein